MSIAVSTHHRPKEVSKVKTIILPVDGSESLAAVSTATDLAGRFSAGIVVAHVTRLQPGARGAPVATSPQDHEAKKAAAQLVHDLRQAGFDAQLELRRSAFVHVADVIADVARRHHAVAIVLASRQRSPIARALASGVSQRLLRVAPCMVVTVTPKAAHAVPADSAWRSVAAA